MDKIIDAGQLQERVEGLHLQETAPRRYGGPGRRWS